MKLKLEIKTWILNIEIEHSQLPKYVRFQFRNIAQFNIIKGILDWMVVVFFIILPLLASLKLSLGGWLSSQSGLGLWFFHPHTCTQLYLPNQYWYEIELVSLYVAYSILSIGIGICNATFSKLVTIGISWEKTTGNILEFGTYYFIYWIRFYIVW